MTSKNPARSCEEVDESVLNYAEVKALCAGNPLIREKMELDVQVVKLKTAKSSHRDEIQNLREKLRNYFPKWTQHAKGIIEALKSDAELANATSTKGVESKFPGMTLMGKAYDGKDEAAKVLAGLCAAAANNVPLTLGSYRGFEMSVKYEEKGGQKATEITLKGKASHSVTLGESETGNITRLNNALDAIGEKVKSQEERLEELQRQTRAAREEVERPFPMEKELEEKSARLNELNLTLNLDEGNAAPGILIDDGDIAPEPVMEEPQSPEPSEAAASAAEKTAIEQKRERERLRESAKRKGLVITTDAQRGHEYSGDILEAGEYYAVQKISRGMGIIHSFIKAPELRDAIAAHGNESLCIRYGKNGKSDVAAIDNGQDKQAETTRGY